MMGPLQGLRRCVAPLLCGSLLAGIALAVSAQVGSLTATPPDTPSSAELGMQARLQATREINRLIGAGQLDAASTKVDALLASDPKDAQARFLKGVVLTEQGKATDAIAVFKSLIEDYPELPEPYNNLASLFAAKGQYELAKSALDMAIQTNPSYVAAYENLGDIYARMATQAYDKVLQLDKTNATAKAKLASINGAMSTAGKPAPTVPAPAKPAAPTKGALQRPAGSAAIPAGTAVLAPVAFTK